MASLQRNERGFSTVETVLVVVIVAAIGFVGWYVHHAKQNNDKTLNSATTSNKAGSQPFSSKVEATTTSTGDTSNQSLQSDLNSANSSDTQSNQDMNSANSGLSDQSTLTSVPQ